jgi:hypothetical protein
MLSLAAAVLYGGVAAACLLAWSQARGSHQQAWHAAIWLGAAVLFAMLIASRVFNVEELARLELREALRMRGEFGQRRDTQGWIVAAVLTLVAAAGLYAAYTITSRISGRRNIAVAVAATSCGVMLAVIAMRMVSLHALDALLFGPLKLNWVGDIGASCATLGAAIYYSLLLRGRLRPR